LFGGEGFGSRQDAKAQRKALRSSSLRLCGFAALREMNS
jgi:hypothetical protein